MSQRHRSATLTQAPVWVKTFNQVLAAIRGLLAGLNVGLMGATVAHVHYALWFLTLGVLSWAALGMMFVLEEESPRNSRSGGSISDSRHWSFHGAGL